MTQEYVDTDGYAKLTMNIADDYGKEGASIAAKVSEVSDYIETTMTVMFNMPIKTYNDGCKYDTLNKKVHVYKQALRNLDSKIVSMVQNDNRINGEVTSVKYDNENGIIEVIYLVARKTEHDEDKLIEDDSNDEILEEMELTEEEDTAD